MLHVPVYFAIDQRQLINSVEQAPIARTLVHRVFRLHKQLHVVQANVSDPTAEAFKTDATLSVSDDVTQSHILDGARRTVSPLLHGKPDGVSVSPPEGFFPAGRDGDVRKQDVAGTTTVADNHIQSKVCLVNDTVGNSNILEIGMRLRADLQRSRRRGQHAVGYGNLTARQGLASLSGCLQAKSIIAGIDTAIAHHNMTASVDVESVSIDSVMLSLIHI